VCWGWAIRTVSTAQTVDIATEAPDFGGSYGIGVIGINQSPELGLGSPAILGLNDVLKADFAAGYSGAAVSNASGYKPVAVEGLSRTGHGVCGLTLNLTTDRTEDLPDNARQSECHRSLGRQNGCGSGHQASGHN
jgi:hypothetical protein